MTRATAPLVDSRDTPGSIWSGSGGLPLTLGKGITRLATNVAGC